MKQCPQCKSTDVESKNELIGGIITTTYMCISCGKMAENFPDTIDQKFASQPMAAPEHFRYGWMIAGLGLIIGGGFLFANFPKKSPLFPGMLIVIGAIMIGMGFKKG